MLAGMVQTHNIATVCGDRSWARLGLARQGEVRQGGAGQGLAWQGSAGRGRARRGEAWQGKATLSHLCVYVVL